MLPSNEKRKVGEDNKGGKKKDIKDDKGDIKKAGKNDQRGKRKGEKEEKEIVKKQKTDPKYLLHVVYAEFGDASILESQSSDEKRFYLVDGGPIKYVLTGDRVEALTKRQLSKPYYQYLLHTLTTLTRNPVTKGIKLDGALVTHPDADHLDGVERLFRELLPHKYQDTVTSVETVTSVKTDDKTGKDQSKDTADKTGKDQDTSDKTAKDQSKDTADKTGKGQVKDTADKTGKGQDTPDKTAKDQGKDTADKTGKGQGKDTADKTGKGQGKDISDKRLICNGPVLLTKKFSDKGWAYCSFSNFLLETEFEVSLDNDDIQKAFGNDIIFTFPTSPGVLYQRKKRSEGDRPYSKEEQEKKLKECADNPDKDKNKSSILLYTQSGGKICLTGDAEGYDIAAMLVRGGVDNLDIFKISHHGSPRNSILKKVGPPRWVFHNLAAMMLLSLSLNKTISFQGKLEEESDIDCFRKKLKKVPTSKNGETVQEVADAFLEVLKEQLKNTKTKPEILFDEIKQKHIEILTAIQKPSGKGNPYEDLEALKPLADWETLKKNVASRLSSKKPKVSLLVKKLMGMDKIFREYFQEKVGIDAFFESFHSKTYYVSANKRHNHPSPEVIRGVIKAAVKKNKPCRIVFTSGGAVPSGALPDANKDKSLTDWNKLVSLYYLKDNVSFKLDPTDDINTAPTGTAKFENDDKIRTDVTAQLEENFGFTIPQRTFLPCLDKYYVKIMRSDNWLEVKGDGTLILSSKKSVVIVSNANTFNGDLRVITLESEPQDPKQKVVQKDVWLKPDIEGGYLIQKSAIGDYLFEEKGSLKSTSDIDKAATFCFEHKIFPALYAPVKNEKNVFLSLLEFLKSLGHKSDQTTISVQSVLEILLGVSNIKLLVKNLPSNFIGIAVLDHEVICNSSTVELSSSVDRKVISSKIDVVVTTHSMTFDSRPVTKLEIVAKELCSNPSLTILISTTLDHISYTINMSEHLKPRNPTVDMYLNALGDVSEDNRNNMTLGILLQRVMGLLPLEALSNCLPAKLLSNKIFTWKIDRSLSTVNYFISPLAVEVLSGDFYIVIPPEMKQISFGGTMIVDLSQIHVMVSDPRTEKSNFVIECDATIGSVPVNLRMAPTSTNLPEVIISFPENANDTSVFNILGLADSIRDLSVPLVNKAIRNLQLSKPSICIAQDVQGYKLTRIASLSFEFSFDNFVSILPSALSTLKDSKASVTIFNPVSSHLQVGFEVEFKLPVPSSTHDNGFLNSKFSLWPADASNHESAQGYACSISLWPSPSGISILSALQAVGLGHQLSSMTSVFPFLSKLLNGILLDQISLEVNCQKKTIDAFSLSLVVPECSIIEGKITMQEGTFLLQYGCHQWYAEAEMKLLVLNKFVCSAAFSLPRPDVPGSLTIENIDDALTLSAFLKGIGISVAEDVPIIIDVLDVSISRVALTCENDGSSFKLTKTEAVIRKRTLTVGSINLYNLELGVCYANVQGSSSMSLSLQGYLNPKTHASLAYDAERRELLGHYVLMENISTNECLDDLFAKEMKDFSNSNAFQQVKSLHVQEVKVILDFPRGKEWSLREFLVSIKGSLSLGPLNLHQLRLVYMNDQTDEAKRDLSVVGHFKSDDTELSFVVELSCTSKESNGTTFKASIKPDSQGGLTLSSLLKVVGLTSSVDVVPQVDGSPDFLNIELKEAFLQFEVSPFRIRKLDVVVKTTTTITILEKPLIQLQEARLEYHLDRTKDPAQTEIFIAGSFVIGKFRLNVTLKKDAKRGLVLEGRLKEKESSKKIDFEKAAKQLSPDVPFSLPKNVALSSFLFRLEKSAEITSIKLEGESHTNWTIHAGFSTITIKNLGGKLNFKRDQSSDAWTGSVYLTGSILLQETVPVSVAISHDSKEGTVAFGNVNKPEAVDLDVITQRFVAGSDSSKSWKKLVPKESKTTVRSPKFNSASLLINFSDKTLLFYGSVDGFGTGFLMVKKTDANENSSKYGFLFGLSLGANFRFSAIDQSFSVVDEVISVEHANLSVISMERVTVKEMMEDFSKFQEHGEKQEEVDVPFTALDKQTISALEMKRGMTVFAKVKFSDGGESRLLSNVTDMQEEDKQTEIILFAHIAEEAEDTLFMATIKEMRLFGGNLKFNEISLTYQPSKGKSFILNGSMSLMLTDDSQPIVFNGTLKISESQADFSMKVGSKPGTIHAPFGMFGVSFEDPQLHLTWKFDQEKKKKNHSPIPICSISGTVKFSKSDSTSEKEPGHVALKGSILFQDGKPKVATISLELSHPLSIDDMFITLFGKKWPSGYLDISFKKGEIYYAKDKVEISGKKYEEGFRGETEIDIFGHAFGVNLSVDKKGIKVEGYTEFEIDMEVATITAKTFEENKGPEIDISRYDGHTKFQLSAGIKILQEEIGSCSLGYDIQQKCFTGEVTYSGELLGVTNPSIEFEWSHKGGFKIRKWPANLDLDRIDFAKEFEKLSQMDKGPCEKLVGLAFDKVIKTKCNVHVKQASPDKSKDPNTWFALKIQGSIDIMIVTEKPAVTVDFPDLIVSVTKPKNQFRLSDLPEFLIDEIGKNSLEIAKQVFNDPEQLTKFMAALGTVKLSRKVLSGLICRGCRSKNVTDDAEDESKKMEDETTEKEEDLDTADDDLASAVEEDASLSDLAADAGVVMDSAADVVSALAAFVSFIAGIVTFFTGKSKKQKEAEKRSAKAKKKSKKARKIIEDRLVVSNLRIALPNLNELEVNWKPLGKNVKYSVALWRTDIGEDRTCLLEKTIEEHKVTFKSDKVKFDSKQFTATIKATIKAKGYDFEGKTQDISKSVIPLLPPPSKLEVESKRDGREVHVKFSHVQYAKEYKVVVVDHHTTMDSAIVKLGSQDKEGTHVFYAEKLKPGVTGNCQVGVCALLQDKGTQEFNYSADLYLVAAPSDVDHSYEPKSQQLSVKWKVSRTQKISGYLCEIQSIEANTVVFSKDVTRPKDDSLESNLKIKLSEISDKAKSPYRIRVCSLGEQGTLASVFVNSKDQLSFLPQVQGISQSYDPQSNHLTVDWVPVTGATKYEVTITKKTDNLNVARKLIPEEKINTVVFDMDQVQLKCGEKYVVSLIAEGLDALHLPSVPSTASTEFALLSKPASVSQEYSFKEKTLKVTFKTVPDAEAHLIEIFNETSPTEIECRHVVPKPADDWPTTITYSFDVATMKRKDSGPFKSRVIAQGNAKWINSLPCVSPTELKRSEAPTSVALKNNIQSGQLNILISSRPGQFTATVEDTVHKSRQVSKQNFVVKQDNETQPIHQTLLKVPLNPAEEPQGAKYQASVVNNGDETYLPSGVKKSNEVLLLDPPASVTQEYENGVFTVVWKCVQSAAGYSIKVYNTKTKSTAAEGKLTTGLRPVGEEMKKEFDPKTLLLQSDGLYQTLITVMGDEFSIGGASTMSKSTIPSYPSPKDVNITFNNETHRMCISCSPVNGTVSIKLGVIDSDKIKTNEGNIAKALLTSKVLTCSSDDGKPVEAEFDVSVLSKSHDSSYKGVAQILDIEGKISLPSGFSISHDEVAWMKPAVPIHMSFDPQNSTVKITWTTVNLAIRYLVEILQTREDEGKVSSLIPFLPKTLPSDDLSCNVNMKNIDIKENDRFQAMVQPEGETRSVIKTADSIGYSIETLVCESSPFNVEVLQVDDEAVHVAWEGHSPPVFQFNVWKMSGEIEKQVITKEIKTNHVESTPAALRMSSPGWYKFGVRAEGSIDKLPSVYTKSDFCAFIMDAPHALLLLPKPCEVTLKWHGVRRTKAQDFSNYVIWYRPKRDLLSEWKHEEVELSKTEKTIKDLQPHQYYLFCISVASASGGIGIRSPATTVHTSDAEVRMLANLIDNPNFEPIGDFDGDGCAYEINTIQWEFVDTNVRGYRLEKESLPQEYQEQDENSPWNIAVPNIAQPCRRVQTIDLLAKGFTPQHLDEMRPPIEAYEWFSINKGAACAYEIKVSLFDSNKSELQEPFSKRISTEDGDGSWQQLVHTFGDYPPGLRFIRFEDCLEGLFTDKMGFDVKAFEPTVKFAKSPGSMCDMMINEQINFEMQAMYALLFVGCSKYRYDTTLDLKDMLLDQSNLYFSQAEDLMKFQEKRGGRVVLQDIKKPDPKQWDNLTGLKACESALALAKQVKEKSHKLSSVAEENNDQELMDFIDRHLSNEQLLEAIDRLSSLVEELKKTEKKPDHEGKDVTNPVNLINEPNFGTFGGFDQDGVCPYDVNTTAWTLVNAHGNMGYRLENKPKLQGIKEYPEQDDKSPWNFAVSNMAIPCNRYQFIDLLAKGFTAEYLDEMRPPIEAYEWFAIREGAECAYEIKVSLLDQDQKTLPGQENSSKGNTADGSWQQLRHTFADYPQGLRFIRFEDGLKATSMNDYDIKAFEPTVKFSKSPGSMCDMMINEQINFQMQAAYAFLFFGCSKYVDNSTADLKNLLLKESHLGFSQAFKLMDFQRNRGGSIFLQDIKKPKQWDDRLTDSIACESALALAKQVHSRLQNLLKVADGHQDPKLMDFIEGYINQQEETIDNLSYFAKLLSEKKPDH